MRGQLLAVLSFGVLVYVTLRGYGVDLLELHLALGRQLP